MANIFQKWLMKQGYYRYKEDLEWLKDGNVVSGKELHQKLIEFRNLKNNET